MINVVLRCNERPSQASFSATHSEHEFKGTVDRLNILSSFSQPHVVSNLYYFHSSVEHIKYILKNVTVSLFFGPYTMKIKCFGNVALTFIWAQTIETRISTFVFNRENEEGE